MSRRSEVARLSWQNPSTRQKRIESIGAKSRQRWATASNIDRYRLNNFMNSLNPESRAKIEEKRLTNLRLAFKTKEIKTGPKRMLDPKDIDDLYWNKEMTIREIAKLKNCSVGPVKRRLKETGGFRNKRDSRLLAFKKGKINFRDPVYREKMLNAFFRAKRPTSLEKKAIEFFEKYRLPFTYCGNGTLLIGYKNPDFYDNNGNKTCLEVSNKRTKDWRYKQEGGWEYYQKTRIEHFTKYGWKCFVIWEEEFKNPSELLQKLGGEG